MPAAFDWRAHLLSAALSSHVERLLHGCGDCRQASFETLCYAKLLRMKLLVLQ